MADFHRLNAPTYFGGLPAGYDYLNDPTDPSVGGTGQPALVDGIKSGGTNDGTYFVAHTEDGRSRAVNRGLGAIGLNTDYLDDILRTSIPKISTTDATAVGAVSTIALTGDIFVGESGMANNATNRNLLVHITEQSDNNDLEVSGSKITSTLIHDGASVNVVGTEADGFYTNPSVNVSPPIPNGTQYRVWYGIRSSLAEIAQTEQGAYFKHQIRVAEHINGTLRSLLRQLHSEASVNQAYTAAWDSTIRSLASAGLNERYRRSTTQPAGFITADYNVAGGGRIIVRDGGAVEVRAANVNLAAAQYPDPQLSAFRATSNITSRTLTGFSTGAHGGDIGFIHESDEIKEDDTVEAVRTAAPGPGFMEVVPKDIRAATSGANNVLTFINPTASASLNPDSVNDDTNRRTIECAAGQHFSFGGGSAIREDIDLIEVVYAGRAPETYIIDSITSSTRIRVRRPNGTLATIFPATATACTIRWIQVAFFAGGHAKATTPGLFFGARFAVIQPAPLTDNFGAEEWPEAPGFYAALPTGADDANGFTSLQWGSHDPTTTAGLNSNGRLLGDGSIECENLEADGDLTLVGAATIGGTLDVTGLLTAVDITTSDDLIVGDDLTVTDLALLNRLTVTGIGIFGAASALTFTAGGTAEFESSYNVTFGSIGNLHVDDNVIIYRVPLHACYVEQDGSTFEDGWSLTRGVAPGVWVQQLVTPSSGAQIFFPLRVEPGDIINDITMVFDGRVGSAGAHAGLPAQQPDLTLVVGPNGTDVATVQGAQVSQANYELPHDITLTGGVFPYTVLNLDYFLRVNGERSTNSQANTAGIKSIAATIVRKKLVSTTFL